MKINATKVLVQDILEEEPISKGGILLPTQVIKTNSMKGKVVQVGDGTEDIKIVYNIGETVLYHPQAGQKFNFDGKEYRLIDVGEIFLGGI